jgi:xylulokinase
MYRASLEGTAYGVRDNLDVMREMGADPKRIVAVGGGAQNPLWLQIVSDVTGKAQIVPERTIGASYGDAFLAGVASGIIPDRDAITREWVKVARTVEPSPAMRDVYEQYHQIYRSLYRSTRDEMHRLAELGQQAGLD